MLQRPPILESSESIHHLLHLIHHCLIPSNDQNPPKSSTRFHRFLQLPILILTSQLIKKRLWRPISCAASTSVSSLENPRKKRLGIRPIPSAKRLQDAGIKIRKKEGEGFCNISFDKRKGLLELPYLHVDSNTETLLRNLVAWEQVHPETVQYFTGYVILMEYMVHSAKDVEILLQSGTMEQSLGSEEEVASMFNGLSTNIVYRGDDDGHVHALRAKRMTDYFSTPWTIASLIAAAILLFLTFT